MTELLRVEDLLVRYGELTALRGASLSVAQGEMVCVIGPNGAGKSTLFAAIAGGLTPRSGDIRLGGRSLVGMGPERIARSGVSIAPEGRRIFSTLTVDENLRLAGYLRRDRAAVEQDRKRMLAVFPRLAERLRYPAGRLSGGEQQMLAVARAMMTRPRLLLIDEPSLGLAPLVVEHLYETLSELRRQDDLTLLVNEQSSARILKYAERIYVLRDGAIQLEGAAGDLQDGEAIRGAYFGFHKTAR